VCSDYSLCAGMCAGKFVANKRMQVPDLQAFNTLRTRNVCSVCRVLTVFKTGCNLKNTTCCFSCELKKCLHTLNTH
jgi:hypothetical protein